MSQEQLVQRMLASEARIDSTKLRTGFISKEEWTRIIQAADYLNKASIFLDDTPSISTFELRAKARRLKSETDLKMIIIDYLQLMRSQSQGERREQEISEISRSLKSLAKELELPVVAISQLNRAVEMRENKRPRLADLRESGAIEQDADLVAFIYRDEFYNPETKDPGIAEVIIAKHRNGPTGEVKMAFLKEYARFDNLSKREEWKDK
jgi:replicative DNA helicase